MRKFQLVKEIEEYNTAHERTNAPENILVTGSQNVLIDTRKGKVFSRRGYSRLGAANTALTPIRAGFTWNTSTGTELPIRMYDDELEVFLGTIDTVVINAWTRVADSFSTTAIMRFAPFFDSTENLDLQVFVQGDDNLYSWNGAVAVVASVTSNTITKDGTLTFAQARFFTASNRTLINVRTGTEFAYTGGESTLTLTGVTGDPTSDGMIAGDILVQKVVTTADTPAANRNNHTIFGFQNQIVVGSEEDNEAFISKNTDFTDFAFSAPRIAGEGALLTLDGISKGYGAIGDKLIAFAGNSSIFRAVYNEITVSTTLTESLSVKKYASGVNQGALNPEAIAEIGDTIVYLSNEVALRSISDQEEIQGLRPRTLSNPIKPDFEDSTFTNAHVFWHKNTINVAIPSDSRLFILEYVENADGKLSRYWQPPQILPVRVMFSFGGNLHTHSNAVPESYKLFDGFSDINSADEKLPINAIAAFSYRNFNERFALKSHDEYYLDGEISTQTNDLLTTFNYEFDGDLQIIEKVIDGTDEDILFQPAEENSLGQQPLAQFPLTSTLVAPEDTSKFKIIFEIAREDYHDLQLIVSTNETDRFWAIESQGPNVTKSTHLPINIRK